MLPRAPAGASTCICLETRYQRAWADTEFPDGIVSYLDAIGLLSPRLTLAHCTWARPDELELIAERGATISVNTSSNLGIRSGIAPLAEMVRRGCRVALRSRRARARRGRRRPARNAAGASAARRHRVPRRRGPGGYPRDGVPQRPPFGAEHGGGRRPRRRRSPPTSCCSTGTRSTTTACAPTSIRSTSCLRAPTRAISDELIVAGRSRRARRARARRRLSGYARRPAGALAVGDGAQRCFAAALGELGARDHGTFRIRTACC